MDHDNKEQAPLILRGTSKSDAAIEILKNSALSADELSGSLDMRLKIAEDRLMPEKNRSCEIFSCNSVDGFRIEEFFSRSADKIQKPVFLNGRPDCFPAIGGDVAFRSGYKLARIPDGYFCHLFGAPVTVLNDRHSIVEEFSSQYARLIRFYDFDLDEVLKNAVYVQGRAIVITDDIRPLNYCHWIIDWLPRLACLGADVRRTDTYVVTTPLQSNFQRESLAACGFEASRIIELDDFSAVRATELLVPSDLREIPHPGHKCAPWVISFLRSTLGLYAVRNNALRDHRGPVYISRADAQRRRLLNEEELKSALARRGYESHSFSDLSLAKQIGLMLTATKVIGVHGAGLTNFCFTDSDSDLLEIFPQSYGTPAFYVLSAGKGSNYSSYIADVVTANSNSQIDDASIDVNAFLRLSEHQL